jgi:hydrogenase maturation protease
MKAKVLIAGVGNIFLGDDAFGSEVARMLLRRSWPENVRVEDFGIRGFDLTFALLDGYDAVILVDATPRGGTPGTVYTVEPDLAFLDSAPPGAGAVETHAMDPMRVLDVARSMGAEFRQLYLVGCEPVPATVDPDGPGQMGLSDPVHAALQPAADVVVALAERILVTGGDENATQAGGA